MLLCEIAFLLFSSVNQPTSFQYWVAYTSEHWDFQINEKIIPIYDVLFSSDLPERIGLRCADEEWFRHLTR